tara:strand:+ start:5308 stop:5874 length:567 start_codon:yes stop_codon:yes gene_type:complete
MTKIIGGKYKGTTLLVPAGKIVRPTSSIKKETLFNILTSYFLKINDNNLFYNKIVLDVFSGTGGLGLESLSRGSKYCYFIEKNKKVISYLEKNCEKILKIKNYKIFNIDYFNLDIKLLDKKIDIVFFDPPYNYKINNAFFNPISSKINKNSIFIIETNNKTKVPILENFELINEKLFKNTKITFLKKT